MNMHQQARNKMQHTRCDCGCTEVLLDERNYEQVCADCGAILEQQIMLTQIQAKGAGGDLERQGKVTNMRSAITFDNENPAYSSTNNIQKREHKIKDKLQYIVSKLGTHHNDTQFSVAIEHALRIWRLCFEKKLTRGYDGHNLAAIIFYMSCRQMKPPLPYLLIDFAAICEINVYKLASKFQKLCRDIPIEINSLTDPSIYIARFANELEFEDETEHITATACKLVDQMKKDWITTGRRPSGICGAAILIAARMHGFKRSIKDIVRVVNLSEATIKKRVTEFLDTKISGMTVDKFRSTTRDEINENANNRADNEQEMPPVIKEVEKRIIKIQNIKLKQEAIKSQRKKEIETFDRKYNEQNEIDMNENCFSINRNSNENDSECEDDDIDTLMKYDIDHGIKKCKRKDKNKNKTVFVKAVQTLRDMDDGIINEMEIKKSNSQKPANNHKLVQVDVDVSDKREMDASEDDEQNNNDEIVENMNENMNGNNVMEYDNNQSYITSARRSDIITENGDIDIGVGISGGHSFIIGANATQLDEYDTFYDNFNVDEENMNNNEDGNGMNKKEKIFKYFEENDLSHLDNDPEIKSMLLSKQEMEVKKKLFAVCNPDWTKVKKDMDRRQMVKEEKERKNKRKLGESYKNDPFSYVAGKMSKRFRSDKLNLEVFHKLMGNDQTVEKSPSVHIKKQDPLSDKL